MKATVILLSSVVLLYSIGCTEKRSDPLATTAIFEMPGYLEQQQHTLLRSDINHDGVDDAVIIVRDSSVRSHQRDSVHVFLWDSTQKAFRQNCCFAVEDFDHAVLHDIEPNAAQNLVVFTDGGGSSATATKGMVLYSLENGCYSEKLRMDHGDPSMEQVDSTMVFVQHDEYASFFSRSESVDYADSIIVPFAQNSPGSSIMQQRFMERYATRQMQTLDSVYTDNIHRSHPERIAYEAAVRRVMALRKLNRQQEATQTVNAVRRRVRGLSQSAKDALQELLDTPL